MQKGVLFLLLLMLNLTVCAQLTVKLREQYNRQEGVLTFRDTTYRALADTSGVMIFSVPGKLQPGHASLFTGRGVINFYIVPGSRQVVNRNNGKLTFGGAGKEINEYLHGEIFQTLNLDYKNNEQEVIGQWRKMVPEVFQKLKAARLPDDFKEKEKIRLYYVLGNRLLIYPMYHSRALRLDHFSPSAGFYTVFNDYIKEDSSAIEFWEYRQLYRDWIQMLAAREVPYGAPYQQVKFKLDYVDQNITGKQLAEYLINDVITTFIRHHGVDSLENIEEYYIKNISNPAYRRNFSNLYEKYSMVASGREAPGFVFDDISGKKVSLTDMKGKYVFIDVWATWCIPCIKEMPLISRLSDQAGSKNIQFVSISIDSDKKAWTERVKKENFTWTQLYAGNDAGFRDNYKISLIPRFILIDPDGRIVNANLKRPSDPSTIDMLEELLGFKFDLNSESHL